ncbi:MAG: hypothetical protein AAGE61_08140 [Pseudomonadota bacterium]
MHDNEIELKFVAHIFRSQIHDTISRETFIKLGIDNRGQYHLDIDDVDHLEGILIFDRFNEPEKLIDFIAQIRKGGHLAPIIVIDDNGSIAEVDALRAGADQVWQKIEDQKIIEERIKQIMELTRQNRLFGQEKSLVKTQLGENYAKALSVKISSISDSIRGLRINTTSEIVEELDEIAEELLGEIGNETRIAELSDKILLVFGRVFDALDSQDGAKILVAGAVAGLVGLGGWTAVTVYTLTMAAWQGKQAFIEAVKAMGRKKGSAD